MKAIDLVKVADEIIIDKVDVVPYTRLSKKEISLFKIEHHPYDNIIYNFSNGEIECIPYGTDFCGNEVDIFDAFNNPQRCNYNVYFKFIEKYHVVAVCLTYFNTCKYKMGEIRNYEIIDHYFITEDKFFVYKENGKWTMSNDKEKLSSALPFSYCHMSLLMNNIKLEFLKLFGIFKYGEKYSFIDSNQTLTKYLFGTLDVFKEEKLTKKLKNISERVLSIKLPSLSVKDSDPFYTKYAKLEYVNSEISVIRWFFSFGEESNFEYMRFYITDDANFLCELKNDGNFHVVTKNINKNLMIIEKLIMDKDELKESKFRYFFDMIDTFYKGKEAVSLYETLKFDLLEKFSKTGLEFLVKKSLNRYLISRVLPYTTIGEEYSIKIDSKETDIYKALGLNKYQYKKTINLFDSDNYYHGMGEKIFSILRILFKKDPLAPINDIDNVTFDHFYEKIVTICNESYYETKKFISAAVEVYSIDAINNGLDAIIKSDEFYEATCILADYAQMVRKINDPKSFPLKFNNDVDIIYEMQARHTAAMEVFNLIEEDIRNENFNEQIKKCLKWEYNGKCFSVISPIQPGDLAKEGLELHHCVKSYIENVADGKTNIMFIRKNSEIDKPFFTVEISNAGDIEQIHGFANKNANTELGLEDFIEEWTKSKKLKIKNFDKIR